VRAWRTVFGFRRDTWRYGGCPGQFAVVATHAEGLAQGETWAKGVTVLGNMAGQDRPPGDLSAVADSCHWELDLIA
jgi:hypothetical protein